MKIDDIPEGLHAVQLAHNICEETCGFPKTQGNLTLIADCITAVGKKMFRSRTDELKLACFWLNRRIEEAQSQGEKVTTHWLRNGEYWGVQKSFTMPSVPRYEHMGQGYDHTDIWYIYGLYQKRLEAAKGSRVPMTDALMEELLCQADKKRKKTPAFRLPKDVSHA